MSVLHRPLSQIDGSSPTQSWDAPEWRQHAPSYSTRANPLNWYCVHTRPQREKQVVEQLAKLSSVEVYFPRLQLQKTIRRVRRQVIEPLFPRYLFCRFDIAFSYRAVRYAHDVIDLVSFGPQPAVVADQLIRDMRSWVGEENLLTAKPVFSPGDRVQIANGPMQGLQAVVLEGHSDSERVAVLLSILGSDARMTIDRSQLAKTA